MPNFDILRESKIKQSFRVSSIVGKFDLQSSNPTERFQGLINLPEHWSIGLIVGKSGSGKTTIARELFGEALFVKYDYSPDKAVIDDMPLGVSVENISNTFISVGFSSPLSWLKPYRVLSNGEKMRVDLARVILEEKSLVVFDEFTSVVDREVAKVTSFCIQKAVRALKDKKFIAVTCHFDVEDWLLPDWTFNTDSMTFYENSKKKDQKSALRYSAPEIRASGKFLVSITI